MSSLRALARLMKELEDQLVVCMRCGLCQAVCPLFAETGREADVARGKLALLDGLLQEILQNPGGVQDHLSRCLLCGSCAANCPSGVKVLDIFIKGRAILAGYLGLSPLKKAVFRHLLAKPGTFNRILAWGAKFQGLFIKPVDDLLGASCARFMSPLLQDRHLKPLAPVPWHRQVGPLNTAAGASGLKVAFFVGCLIDKLYPAGGGRRADHALEHHGVGLLVPPEQGCCGIPALAGGDTATFDKLVRHNLALFAGQDFRLPGHGLRHLHLHHQKALAPDDPGFSRRKSRPGLPPWPTRPWTSASSWWIRWVWRREPPRRRPPSSASPTTTPAT